MAEKLDNGAASTDGTALGGSSALASASPEVRLEELTAENARLWRELEESERQRKGLHHAITSRIWAGLTQEECEIWFQQAMAEDKWVSAEEVLAEVQKLVAEASR